MDESATKEGAIERNDDFPASASAGELYAAAGGSIVKDEGAAEGNDRVLPSKSEAASSPTNNSDHAPGGTKPQDGGAAEKSLISVRDQWLTWRQEAARRPIQALWHLCDECLLNLHRENRRLHIDSCSEPLIPLVLTFTSETPVSVDSTDRGTLFRHASVALSDVTFLLSRNYEEFELTLLCHDLQSESEAVIKVTRWSFEDLEEFVPTLCREVPKDSAYARIFAAIAGGCSNGGNGDDLACAAKEGIQLLLRQLERMSCDPWATSSHVGCFLFHTIASHGGNTDWLSLGRIRSLMPTVFLNIHSDIDLLVGSQQPSFGYYNNLLAELTRFSVVVDSATGRWRPVDSVGGTVSLDGSERLVHVFIGFDALRCKSDKKRNTSLVFCFLGEMGLLNNVELKPLDPGVGCGLSLLFYATNAPTTRNVTAFHFAEDTNEDYELFKRALSEIAQTVRNGFLTHHWDESCKSMPVLVRRIQSVAGRVYDAINGESSITDPLPSCNVNTFGNWSYHPSTRGFADGYVVEIGLDTIHHLPPSGSFADAAKRHPTSCTDRQGLSCPSEQNPTRCPEALFERGRESLQANHVGRKSTEDIQSNRALPTLVTPYSKLPHPQALNEPSMGSASAAPETGPCRHQLPTATMESQLGHDPDRLEDDTPLPVDFSTASNTLALLEAQNEKLREKLAVAEEELRLYRAGLVNANEVAAMAKQHNASLISANQCLIAQVQMLTASNENLKRQAQLLMAQSVPPSKKVKLCSTDRPPIDPYNAFIPPGSWPA